MTKIIMIWFVPSESYQSVQLNVKMKKLLFHIDIFTVLILAIKSFFTVYWILKPAFMTCFN